MTTSRKAVTRVAPRMRGYDRPEAIVAISRFSGGTRRPEPPESVPIAMPSTIVSRLELSIVIPTFNEKDNVRALLARLETALAGIAWEAIFVDDNSPDGTANAIRDMAASHPNVRRILRIGRRGLAGASIEGMLASTATYVAVIDADLQHDEAVLPRMLKALRCNRADLVIGSRYVEGGGSDAFSKSRGRVSRLSGALARHVLGVDMSDPMSGFFMLRQDRVQQLAPALSTQGFKVLLDIVATAKGALRIVELPYTFGTRVAGESKLSSIVAFDFLGLLLAKLTRDLVPVRFLLYSTVGTLGLVVHLAALHLALGSFDMPFAWAQATATLVAMTGNYIVNNRLTYRDRRLSGLGFVRGLFGFYVVCGIGFFANVGVSGWLHDGQQRWWVAGVAGAAMGTIWNYAMSSQFVWRNR